MPLCRYRLRNEYSLADPELYRAADKDDPEALLEGVAMAGLVGVLRQLGDLAEFAAEIFHDLHEEVMATAARGHGLMARVQQLESDFPSIEKAFLSQTSHSSFYYNTGTDWHPNLHMEQNLITRGDLPRFVMDSYEECRGPPRLFLLDKFDVGGAGACLKRYTDPSFFKVELLSPSSVTVESQKERKIRKAKKKGSRWRNAETPDMLPASHAKLHQLFLEERVETGISDPARRVKLKRRLNGFPFDSKSGESYMEKFLKDSLQEQKLVHEISGDSSPLKLPWNVTIDSGLEIHEISTVISDKGSVQGRSLSSSPNMKQVGRKVSVKHFSKEFDGGEMLSMSELSQSIESDAISSVLHKDIEEKEILIDGGNTTEVCVGGYQSDDIVSEVDNYMDALATMESEVETETELRSMNYRGFLYTEKHGAGTDVNEEQHHAHFSDSQSIENFTAYDDGISSFKKGIFSSSFSDSPSNSADNILSEGDFSPKIFPSSKTCDVDVTEKSSEHLFVNQRVLLTLSPEHGCSTEASSKITGDSSYKDELSEPSYSLSLVDPAPTRSDSDQESTARKDVSTDSQLTEASSKSDRNNISSINCLGNSSILFQNTCVTSNSSGESDGFPLVVSSEKQSVDDLNESGQNMATSTQFSNILVENRNRKNIENSFGDLLKVEYAENRHPDDLIRDYIYTPHLVVSHTEEQLITSSCPELGLSKHDVIPEALKSDVDNNVLKGSIETGSNLAEDSSDSPDLTSNLVLGTMSDNATLNFDSREVDDLYFKGQSCDQMSTSIFEEKPVDAIPSIAIDESEIVNPNAVSLAEVSNNLESEVISANVISNDDVNSSSMNLKNFPDSSFGVLDNHILVSAEACIPVEHEEAGAKEQANQLAVSPEFNYFQDNVLSGVCFVPMSSVDLDAKSLNLCDSTFPPTSLVCSGQDSELNSNQVNAFDNTEAVEIVSPDMNLLHVASADESEADSHNNMPNISLSAEAESGLNHTAASVHPSSEVSVHNSHSTAVITEDSSMHSPAETRSLVGDEVDLVDDQLVLKTSQISPTENTASASLLSTSTKSVFQEVQKLKLQIDQHDMESPLHVEYGEDASLLPVAVVSSHSHQLEEKLHPVAETHLESLSLVEHGKSENHVDYEKQFGTSTEYCPVTSPTQSLMLDLLRYPGCSKVDIPEQSVCPANSSFPVLGMFSETSQINLEEIPPLPPLPPIQWRMGRHQEATPALDSDVVNQMDSLHNGYSEILGKTNPLNPCSLHLSNKSCNSQHSDEVNLVNSSTYSLETETMANHVYGHDNSFTFDVTHPESSSLRSRSTFSGMPQHDLHTVEGERSKCSLDTRTSETTLGGTASIYLAGSPDKFMPQCQEIESETGLENERQDDSGVSEEKVINSWKLAPPMTTEENGPPLHVFPASMKESAWTTVEEGNPKMIRPTKLPRPRNPLIDAVVAHDKSKLRKASDRIRPQIQKVDERDSLLEQIRAKSFNLKPAAVNRPNFQGPKTNLKVAAILEKANAIRQALAGSDEDDDDDNWSDS